MSISASAFDKHFWLRFALRASTCDLVLNEHFGLQFRGDSQFLASMRASRFHACFRLWPASKAFISALGFYVSFGRCSQHWRSRHSWRAEVPAVGGSSNWERMAAPQQQPCLGSLGSSAVIESCSSYTSVYCSYSTDELVGHWHCSTALERSAEAAWRAKEGLRVNQPIITSL